MNGKVHSPSLALIMFEYQFKRQLDYSLLFSWVTSSPARHGHTTRKNSETLQPFNLFKMNQRIYEYYQLMFSSVIHIIDFCSWKYLYF